MVCLAQHSTVKSLFGQALKTQAVPRYKTRHGHMWPGPSEDLAVPFHTDLLTNDLDTFVGIPFGLTHPLFGQSDTRTDLLMGPGSIPVKAKYQLQDLFLACL